MPKLLNTWRNKRLRLLILGGTAEATALIHRLQKLNRFDMVLSLAGRTERAKAVAVNLRIGGFGGVEGLSQYLIAHQIDALIVATHPFAAQMAQNAFLASQLTQVPALALARKAWQALPEDNWHHFNSLSSALQALGPSPHRLFLTIGRQQLSTLAPYPQHDYVIRCIDAPNPVLSLPQYELILARGPFDLRSERALFKRINVDFLLTKNSGGKAVEAKLQIARERKIPVLMIDRPESSGLPFVYECDDVLRWLEGTSPVTL